MKPLLALLGSLTVGVSPALATLSSTPTYNKNNSTQDEVWPAPTSVGALTTGIDNAAKLFCPPTWSFDRSPEERNLTNILRFFDDFIHYKTGELHTLDVVPEAEVVEESFEEVFINDTPNPQTFQTHSYTREVETTTTFNLQLHEEISITTEVNFVFAGSSINASISSDQVWSKTVSETQTITAPAQAVTINPYSKGIVRYIVKSGTYNVLSSLRIPYKPTDVILSAHLLNPDDGHTYQVQYSLDTVIDRLAKAGYADLISFNSDQFSQISTDDVENPTKVSFNLPIDYVSKGGRIEVNVSEEPIS